MDKVKKLILAVDDEQAILDLLEMILTDEGYELTLSLDGTTLKIAPR